MKLYCNFEINNNIIRSETYLEQKSDDGSIYANVFPCEITPNLTIAISDCSLTSIVGSSDLLLDKTSGIICENITGYTANEKNVTLKVKLSSAKLISTNPPEFHKKVLIQFYLTNIPYSFKTTTLNILEEGEKLKNYQTPFKEINIPGKPKIVIKHHSEGVISHITEVEGVFSDLDNIIELVNSICLLISFASGCLCSIAKIKVLDDHSTVYLEYISPENTELNRSIKVISLEEDVIEFVQSTYNHYISNINKYKLKELIILGILAKHTQYTELKTLLMCNFLEILRYNYAINSTHITQRGDDFYWAISNSRRLYFNEILQDFCKTNSLKGWTKNYTNIRNQIIHQGKLIGNTSMEEIQNYRKLHHFCDRVILTLLEWDKVSGFYIPRHQPNRKSINSNKVNRIKFKR